MTDSHSSSSSFIVTDILDFDKSFTDLEAIKSEGFNSLFKAKRYGKWFLLKGLRPEYASQTLYKELLRKEFEISVTLEHPNIVHTIGFEEVPSIGYCIVFEYLEGENLRKYLSKKRLIQERERIADELIDALSYVHERQIVHRDLKPENIIITTNGHHLKLIDFGLADTDAHAILKQPAGTTNYISPEQRTATTADCRNDLYSLGKILLEINPGFIYRHVAQRCLCTIDKRYAHAYELQKGIELWKHWKRTITYIIASLLLVCITFIMVYMLIPSSQTEHQNTIDQTISYGKTKIDQINKPLQTLVDTITIFNKENYALNEELVSRRNLQLENLLDSLTHECTESDKAIIQKALKDYIDDTTPHF